MTSSGTDPEVASGAGAASKRRSKRVEWLIAVGIFALIAVASTLFAKAGNNSSVDPNTAARMACEEFVGRQLKAPATADYSDEVVTGGPLTYTVTGSVDAQNSFGAKIRSQFTCETRHDGDNWLPVSVSGLDG